MASRKKKQKAAAMEAIALEALESIDFVYGEATEQDEITIRAMVLRGATSDQINRAITIAAVNSRVVAEEKSRYAFGVLRNILDGADW